MRSDFRERTVDVAIALSLTVFPLLPTGPSYLGFHWPWALEVFFLLFVLAGTLFLLVSRAQPGTPSYDSRDAVRLLRRGYLIWLIPVVAATLLGLFVRMPFDAVRWQLEAEDLAYRLGGSMNQAADPFYPLRVGLNCLEGGVMFWLLSALLSRTSQPSRRTRAAVYGCLVGIAVVSLVAIGQYFTRWNLHVYWVLANPDLTRSHATLDDPNTLASYLVLGIGLASGVAWSAARRGQTVGATLVAALALSALMSTVSRAGWAGLLLSGLVCVALLPRPLVRHDAGLQVLRRIARVLVVGLLAGGLLWTAAAIALPKRTTSIAVSTPWQAVLQTIDPRTPLETVLKGRQILWRAGLDLAGQHWTLGAGLGAYPRFVRGYPGSPGAENAHNYFLQVLAEAGLIGLAALVFFLVTIALAIWPSSRDAAVRRLRLCVGLSAGLVAFVLTWFTGHPLLALSNQLWLAAVLAVGATAIATVEPGPSMPMGERTARTRVWILHPGLVVAAIVVTGIAAVPRAVAMTRRGSAFIYASGLYGWESGPAGEGAPPDPRYRWTRVRAVVHEPVRGAILIVPIYVGRTVPFTLQVTVGGVDVEPVTFSTLGWHSLSYDLVALLGEQRWKATSAISVEFNVSPVFVPSRAGLSNDNRELGVGIGVLSWSGPNRPRQGPR